MTMSENVVWVIDNGEILAMRGERWIWHAPIPCTRRMLCRVLLDLEEKIWFDKFSRRCLLSVLEIRYKSTDEKN